jgi:hypothetical protein
VWRDALFYKLIINGVGGNLLATIKDMYSKVIYHIKCRGGITEAIRSLNGVKQGCVLSPLLFNTFMYDLPGIFDTSCHPVKLHDFPLNCLLYADDMVLLSETANGLQNCLEKLDTYCNRWKLKVNVQKTKIIIFNKGACKISKHTFYLGNEHIEITQNYQYLGLVFNVSGSFNNANLMLKDKSLKTCFGLIGRLKDCKANVGLKIFRSLINHILSYASEVWASYYIVKLNDTNLIDICDRPSTESVAIKFAKSFY